MFLGKAGSKKSARQSLLLEFQVIGSRSMIDIMGTRPSHLLSWLGITTAVAAFVGASCCVLPLLLAWAGLAGAWLIYLEPFVVYRRTLVVLAVTLIAAGWWLALRRRAPRRTLVVLACASALTLGAVAVTEYEGPLQRYVLALKRAK